MKILHASIVWTLTIITTGCYKIIAGRINRRSRFTPPPCFRVSYNFQYHRQRRSRQRRRRWRRASLEGPVRSFASYNFNIFRYRSLLRGCVCRGACPKVLRDWPSATLGSAPPGRCCRTGRRAAPGLPCGLAASTPAVTACCGRIVLCLLLW